MEQSAASFAQFLDKFASVVGFFSSTTGLVERTHREELHTGLYSGPYFDPRGTPTTLTAETGSPVTLPCRVKQVGHRAVGESRGMVERNHRYGHCLPTYRLPGFVAGTCTSCRSRTRSTSTTSASASSDPRGGTSGTSESGAPLFLARRSARVTRGAPCRRPRTAGARTCTASSLTLLFAFFQVGETLRQGLVRVPNQHGAQDEPPHQTQRPRCVSKGRA